MPGQNSRASSSHRNKEKFLINICEKLVCFCIIIRLYSTVNALTT